ncbi:unnamed protein product, partial [Ixodes persulcatus]
ARWLTRGADRHCARALRAFPTAARLWQDLDIFREDGRVSSGAKPPSLLRGIDASPYAVQRPRLAHVQRSPLTASDPLCDYLVRPPSDGDQQPIWSRDPYEKLPGVAGSPWDPASAVLLTVGGYNPEAPFETAT